MHINGILIADYRSIGKEQRIERLGKINLFVGSNNSGKSNILRFVNDNLERVIVQAQNSREPGPQSIPHTKRNQPSKGGIAVACTLEGLKNHLKHSDPRSWELVQKIKDDLAPDDLIWLTPNWPSAELVDRIAAWRTESTFGFSFQWRDIWSSTLRRTGGDMKGDWIPEVIRSLRALVPPSPSVRVIPVPRSVRSATSVGGGPTAESRKYFDGIGDIEDLNALKNPEARNYDESRALFKKVERFVKTVTDDDTAELDVPFTKSAILVRFRGQPPRPLAELGSGIEQVVLYAIAATSVSDAVVTFEEPELHLHPVLQRQLMKFLGTTSNQYFIATHSAHIIDVEGVEVFHVRLVEGETRVEKATTDAARRAICDDLGYRPSDIVQANCVIWVEGPSDRVYIRHWISTIDPHLVENVHYSIMFYGGKLLSHLSADETDASTAAAEDVVIEDLIQLRFLNRECAVVMDSDRANEAAGIRHTKARLQDEIRKHGGCVWITRGREVENYLDPTVLKDAVEKVAPGRGQFVKAGKWERCLPASSESSGASVDKIAVAKEVVQQPPDLNVLDLRERITDLRNFIRKANGLPL